jgi:thiol-disulfide isomerase/thioredoxin
LPVEGHLLSFDGATGWLNSSPLTAAELRGRVVLVNFWTYTCINWLRTLPYVRAWAQKYQEHGLVVIGVHTPEFDVEHDLDNARRQVKDLWVDYPVAVDNDYAIWTVFDNHYWPACYFVDAQGQIRHHRFGEGDYQMSEMIVQQLLAEAGGGGIDQDPTRPVGGSSTASRPATSTWSSRETPSALTKSRAWSAIVSTVPGVSPLELATPALSKRITGRSRPPAPWGQSALAAGQRSSWSSALVVPLSPSTHLFQNQRRQVLTTASRKACERLSAPVLSACTVVVANTVKPA